MKLEKVEKKHPNDFDYIYPCQGCGTHHGIRTVKEGVGPVWKLSGGVDYPTVTPSVKVTSRNAKGPTVCHFFITNGQIRYLDDCTHDLAGQTVDMEDVNDGE